MRNAEQVVEQEFLQVRAKILEIAAFFDRLSTDDASAAVTGANAERLKLLREGCDLLLVMQRAIRPHACSYCSVASMMRSGDR